MGSWFLVVSATSSEGAKEAPSEANNIAAIIVLSCIDRAVQIVHNFHPLHCIATIVDQLANATGSQWPRRESPP
jgi:hypothetical protein